MTKMASVLLLGAFLLTVTIVTPTIGMGAKDLLKGPLCRIVNRTNEAVLQSTPCPFSDWDDPPYTCVDSSKSNSRSGLGNLGGSGRFGLGGLFDDEDEEDGDDFMSGFFSYFNFRQPSLPRTRKDYCKLNLKKIPANERCTQDSDCKSYPGLMETKCNDGKCIPEPTSVALTMLASEPCEIGLEGSEEAIYKEIEPCQDRIRSMFHYINPVNWGRSRPAYECPQDPQLLARVGGRSYDLKLCVKVVEEENDDNNNNDNNNNDNNNNENSNNIPDGGVPGNP